MLIAWRWFAAVLLVVTAIVHASTFFGIDPMDRWPGVMLLHLAIFPPFIAALYYSSRVCPGSKNLDPIFNSAPRWLRCVMAVCFVYGLLNFVIFMSLNEGGGPQIRDGKYVLTSHGKLIRELTEEEYHQQRAYVVRGFSGHWMLFASASLTFMMGAARLRHSSESSLASCPSSSKS